MSKHLAPKEESNQARTRLISAALRLFVEKGYEAATTREICEAANANISQIRYYFGDKAGLYRAAYTEPLGDLPCQAHLIAMSELPLASALELFFNEFLQPLKLGPDLNLLMKLRFREMLEPTGAWEQEIEAEIKPQHEALLALIQKHLKLDTLDVDAQRLAFAIIGIAVHYFVGQDVIRAISPQIITAPGAIDVLTVRLATYAVSMIEGEAKRRELEGAHAST
jgi:AcrR family transcriptional regulator